jgi:hypothetical protein
VKTINERRHYVKFYNWEDLKPYGIRYLTGERDPYGIRLLVDLTEEGKELLEGFFCAELKCGENWNSGAVASIMLPRDLFKSLVEYIVFYIEGMKYLIDQGSHGLFGYMDWKDGDLFDLAPSFNWHVLSNPLIHEQRNTNVHQFSGRG